MNEALAYMAIGAVIVIFSALRLLSKPRGLGFGVCMLGNAVFVVGSFRLAAEFIR